MILIHPQTRVKGAYKRKNGKLSTKPGILPIYININGRSRKNIVNFRKVNDSKFCCLDKSTSSSFDLFNNSFFSICSPNNNS